MLADRLNLASTLKQDNNSGAYTYQGGIIFRFPVAGMVPFVHGLAGAAQVRGPGQPALYLAAWPCMGPGADGWRRSGL